MQTPISNFLGKKIGAFIDFFHFPFKKIFTKQLFRYAVCGVANMVFGWVVYWFLLHYIFQDQDFHLLIFAFKPHTAAFFLQLPITFFTGFWLSKYVSFSESNLRGRTQIVRYLMIVIACVLINYAGLKLFVEVCHIYPTPSQMLNTVITTVFSFFTQKYFSFKA
ncbi:MAG: GtrA family protein [Prevotellaceae bacterium]|jgi:putative flippase GtrA|nr:GtrA family protein [Prevotellaceae bacterium]